MDKRVNIPITQEEARKFVAGERLLLNGTMYTARDAAHKKIIAQIEEGVPTPIEIKNSTLYYAGPAPSKPNQVIGSCGPTTSGRMDLYAPKLIAMGQSMMIGKGLRNVNVIEAMKQYGSVYVTAIGGAGALLSKCVMNMQCIAFAELGPEAIYRLEVKDFPVIVTIDAMGNNLYESEYIKYKK
ncbi:MAG: FumA C-terminus/TtdB family hydratase beta subunit [Cellulosilyticaceae bacterium]